MIFLLILHCYFFFPRCGKSFCSPQKLKNHVLNIHEGIKDYKCDICGYLTWESCRLKTHINVVHEGKKNYQCDRCEKSFGYLTHLKNHISVVHEGIKKFECSFCSKTFSSNFNLYKLTTGLSRGNFRVTFEPALVVKAKDMGKNKINS